MATKLRNIFLFIILISVILSGKTNIVSASEGTTYTYDFCRWRLYQNAGSIFGKYGLYAETRAGTAK